jgi:hypothetical protein
MTARERLPNRRQCESLEFRHSGHPFTPCAGFYAHGRIDRAESALIGVAGLMRKNGAR